MSLQVAEEKGPANSVPAAAVIRKVRALSGIIGFKGSAGGSVSQLLNIRAQLCYAVETIFLEYAQGWRIQGVAVKCLDILKNSDREGSHPERN